MFKRLLIFITLILTTLTVFSFPQYTISPLPISIPSNEYGAANKNWGIALDNDGTVYIANNNGLLQYNGLNWRLYQDAPCSIIRSVAIGNENEIFTGGFKEFGYWRKNEQGDLTYTSLSALIPEELDSDMDIWRINITKDGAYFQSFSKIFFYDGITLSTINPKQFIMYLQDVRGELYIDKDGMLSKISGKNLVDKTPLPYKEVRVILPYGENEILIGGGTQPLYILDGNRKRVWNSELSEEIRKADLNCALRLKNGNYLFGTLMNGVFETDNSGKILHHYDTGNGLSSNTVHALGQDSAGNIWIALDEGICKLEYKPELSFFIDASHKMGSVSTAAYYRGFLYLGTNKGLFALPADALNKKDPFRDLSFIAGSEGQVWDLGVFGNELLCANNQGLFVVSGSKASFIYKGAGVFNIQQIERNKKEYLILSTYHTPILIGKEGAYFRKVQLLNGFTGIFNSLNVDAEGFIWFGHLYDGVIQSSLSDDLTSLEVINSYPNSHFTSSTGVVRMGRIGHRTVFIANNRFFVFNDISNRIEPFDELNNLYLPVKGLQKIVPISSTLYWLVGEDSRTVIKYDKGKAEIIELNGFDSQELSTVDDFENIVLLNDTLSLICLNNGFALYSHTDETNGDRIGSLEKRRAFVDRINRIDDSGISFNIAFPYSSEIDKYYQYKLDGLDSAWSAPVKQSQIRFERLPHGNYTFQIRPVGVRKGESPLEERVSFKILAPWYLRSWAIAIWIILMVTALFTGYYFVKKSHRKALLKQAKENEEKLMREKNRLLEQKVKSTNNELFDVTATMLKKNEVLHSIKEEIDSFKAKHPELTVTKKLDKITRSINDDQNAKEDWSLFIMHFEQTHEHFFKNVQESYPSLTAAELKLCACLKLNLTTKDIASLLNISIRGVEAGRYRLRKKMNLNTAENLNEYFMKNF
ncbi:MAG: triple tyrosine motif-containing protein [Bacteroidales bacterium]